MSVNYYLDNPHNEAGHIGRWAAGYFTAKAPEHVNSFDDWAAWLHGHRIFAEHGTEYSPDEMVAMTKPTEDGRRYNLPRFPREAQGEFIERGVLFVRYEFC